MTTLRYILGIETSCDETGVALLRQTERVVEVLSEHISSQTDLHAAYGGVVPELASREHLTNLPLLVDSVLNEVGIGIEELSAVGVTRGPGLKGCLLVGLSFARGLCAPDSIPLLGINHIEGHILIPMLDNPDLQFPFLALVVSGGHTEILVVRGVGQYELVARTMDDAAGEAFDKSANLLGFSYPGGAKLAEEADSVDQTRFELPRIMPGEQSFSFSGLKTAIALLVKRQETALRDSTDGDRLRRELAYAVQNSIVTTLCEKLELAIRRTGVPQVVVTGGVSANRCLREHVSAISGVEAYFPTLAHCMDNGTMIAYCAAQRYQTGERLSPDINVLSRWPVEGLVSESAEYIERGA